MSSFQAFIQKEALHINWCGQPMKASLTLRLPEELRRKIRKEARHSDMSINQYVLYTLTKEISYKEAERGLKERIRKATSREEALRLLDAIVPDVPALPQDELSSDHIQVLP